MDLNERQKKFCREYIVDLNGKQAAIRAGYSAKTAEVKGSQLLSLVKVKVYIEELMEKRGERTKVTADMVISELSKVAFHDIRKFYNDDGTLKGITDLDDDSASILSSFKTRKENKGDSDYDIIEEYKRQDKMKALELLGKHFGIFTDKIDVDMNGSIKIEDEIIITVKK